MLLLLKLTSSDQRTARLGFYCKCDYTYDTNSFYFLKAHFEKKDSPNRIGKLTKTVKNDNGTFLSVEVHCFGNFGHWLKINSKCAHSCDCASHIQSNVYEKYHVYGQCRQLPALHYWKRPESFPSGFENRQIVIVTLTYIKLDRTISVQQLQIEKSMVIWFFGESGRTANLEISPIPRQLNRYVARKS